MTLTKQILLTALISLTLFTLATPGYAAKKVWKKRSVSYIQKKVTGCNPNAGILKGEHWQMDYAKVWNTVSGTLALPLPFPDGTVKNFTLQPSGTMSAELAAKFPGLKSFSGQCVEDNSYKARIDFNDFGFHALVTDATGQIFLIEPFCNKSKTYYSVYNKADFKSSRPPFNENGGGGR